MLAYEVDVDACVLTPLGQLATLPAKAQYACATSSPRRLYVASSDGGPGRQGSVHYLTSFEIDERTPSLRRSGDDIALRQRPIHISTDADSEHVLVAYNEPSTITVHRLLRDGGVGAEVGQPADLDAGIYAHEIRVTSSNRTAIAVARGNDPRGGQAEEPGALKVFTYDAGVLHNRSSVSPAGGVGFGPRNIDVAPNDCWIYVSLERQNQLATFAFDGTTAAAAPSFQCATLEDLSRRGPVQLAGAVRVHPSGRFVYLANRASGTTEVNGRQVFAGGENTIVVFGLDGVTGEPGRIQSIDSGGISPRTFSIDPDGRLLIVGNSRSMVVRDGVGVAMRSANLSVFAIAANGLLEHRQTYEIEDSGEQLFWSGLA